MSKTQMRCNCTANTPKGVSYHPALKALYERKGSNAEFVKVGYRCPNCGQFYDLNVVKKGGQ